MSEEFPQASNESQTQDSEATLIFDDVANLDTIEFAIADANPRAFSVDMPLIDRTAFSTQEGVVQQIHGIVKAGDELFGVIKAGALGQGSEGAEKMLLTRFAKSRERAELIGVLEPGNPLIVGRNHQDGLSETTSRNHFKVGMYEGQLILEDLQSSNGTEVLTASPFAKSPNQSTENPLHDYKKWSPKSSEVRAALLSSQNGESEAKVPEASPNAPRELITGVPNFDKEFKAQHKEKESDILKQLKDLETQFNEEDQRNLWQYSAGSMNKREAQALGQGQESINQGQLAGQAYTKLSSKAKEAANQHLGLMQALNKARRDSTRQ